MPSDDFTIPSILTADRTTEAVALLQRYFGLGSHAEERHTGSSFEMIGRPWDSVTAANVITSDDLIALATLSVPVSGGAAVRVFTPDFQSAAARALAEIPTSLSIRDPGAAHAHDGPGLDLWTLVRALPDFGPTRASKLLARKRPRLFPIYDSVIASELGIATPEGHWKLMRDLAATNGGALITHATRLAELAGVDAIVTPLRVIDVVLWRHGRDRGLESSSDA